MLPRPVLTVCSSSLARPKSATLTPPPTSRKLCRLDVAVLHAGCRSR